MSQILGSGQTTAGLREPERRGLKGHWGPRELLRLCWRGATVVTLIGAGLVEAVVRRPGTRAARAAWVHRLCGRILRSLGIPVTQEGSFPATGAVVLNHQGYLDILAVAALHPCVFVSKAEVRRYPVIGWMTTMAGTVYVERGRGGSGAAASVRIREAADDGLPIVFFPEGTTSNGQGLLPFHGGLLAESREAGLAVTVGVVRYAMTGPRGATVGDDAAYWGDRNLLQHILRFLTLRGVRVQIRFAGEPVVFREDDRKLAAAEARASLLQLADGALLETEAQPGAAGQG